MTAERTLRLVLFIAALLVLLLGLGSDAPYRQIEQLLQMPQSIHFTAMNKVLDNHYDTPIYQEWLRQMEEYLGVKLDITWKNLSYYNSQELIKKYMASGQFDDVFLAVDQNKINELGDAGLLVDVMAYPNQLPNYWQYLNDNYNFSYVSTQNGNIYGFAQGEIGTHCGNQRAFAYREDIFRRHRIKIPETLEEFYQAAKRLKKIYPQSYPVGGGRNDEPAYSVYSVFLNVNRTHYTIYYNGERYVLPPVDDGEQFYATLEFLHQMYAEGLIDPDFLTQTMEQGLERMENGRNFIVPNFWTGEIRNVNERSEDSSVCWCIAPRPRSYRNEVGWKMESQWEGYRLIPGDMAVISQKAENRELLIRLLDYQ